jgi:ribosomal protein S21
MNDLQKPSFLFILFTMAIEARKKEGESGNSLLYTFTRKVKRSGILKEVRHRKFHVRATSRIKRRASAIHREEKKAAVERQKKLGLI